MFRLRPACQTCTFFTCQAGSVWVSFVSLPRYLLSLLWVDIFSLTSHYNWRRFYFFFPYPQPSGKANIYYLGNAPVELHKKQSGKKKFFDYSKQIFGFSYCKAKKKKTKKQSFVVNLTYAGFSINYNRLLQWKVYYFFQWNKFYQKRAGFVFSGVEAWNSRGLLRAGTPEAVWDRTGGNIRFGRLSLFSAQGWQAFLWRDKEMKGKKTFWKIAY